MCVFENDDVNNRWPQTTVHLLCQMIKAVSRPTVKQWLTYTATASIAPEAFTVLMDCYHHVVFTWSFKLISLFFLHLWTVRTMQARGTDYGQTRNRRCTLISCLLYHTGATLQLRMVHALESFCKIPRALSAKVALVEWLSYPPSTIQHGLHPSHKEQRLKLKPQSANSRWLNVIPISARIEVMKAYSDAYLSIVYQRSLVSGYYLSYVVTLSHVDRSVRPVRPSVCLSVRHDPMWYRNGLTLLISLAVTCDQQYMRRRTCDTHCSASI